MLTVYHWDEVFKCFNGVEGKSETIASLNHIGFLVHRSINPELAKFADIKLSCLYVSPLGFHIRIVAIRGTHTFTFTLPAVEFGLLLENLLTFPYVLENMIIKELTGDFRRLSEYYHARRTS